MRLEDALPLLEAACRRPFRELFAGHPEDLRTNKGHTGQLLLVYIGLKLDSNLIDFDDGELKTNKALPSGQPLETMFISQISRNFDTLVGLPFTPFEESNLYRKIRNLVYLPVVKASLDAGDWYFTHSIHIQTLPGTLLYAKLAEDYAAIGRGLVEHIEHGHDGMIHTTNGPHYLQVRTKDSKPYHPIYSKQYGRTVSTKNFAFYFKKNFMRDAIEGKFEL